MKLPGLSRKIGEGGGEGGRGGGVLSQQWVGEYDWGCVGEILNIARKLRPVHRDSGLNTHSSFLQVTVTVDWLV